jgi:hypothetical protein
MPSLSSLVGGKNQVASIVNGFNSGSPAGRLLDSGGGGFNVGVSNLASGALTAATLATVLNISGRGTLNFCAAKSADTTSRTIRLQVTIDGRVIFNSTSAAIAATGNGIIAAGNIPNQSGGNQGVVFQPIPFNTSCLVQIASSLSETDKITTMVNYEVNV